MSKEFKPDFDKIISELNKKPCNIHGKVSEFKVVDEQLSISAPCCDSYKESVGKEFNNEVFIQMQEFMKDSLNQPFGFDF